MPPILGQLTKQISVIDLQFQRRPQVIASYLFYDGNAAALIETGPASTVETLIESVRAAGVPLEALRHLIVTHIHLDHSGAAGVLARRLPWVRVYVHPVGAPHLADPSKLLASAKRLYGEQMETLWGAVLPVPAENLVIVNDRDEIRIPGSTLCAFDTPGHAKHHHAYLDASSGLLFTGDVGGVRMPGVRYVRPPTPPPELDIAAWRASIAKLRALNATGLCPTHFGLFRGDIAWHWEDLEKRLVAWGEIVRTDVERGASDNEILERVKSSAAEEFKTLGVDPNAYDVAVSYESLVSGYVRYWRQRMLNE